MRHRLWTPAFVALAVANFFCAMIFYLLVPVMTSYAVERFGTTPGQGGTLASIFFIGALLARLVSGWSVERFGPRRVALGSAVLFLASTAGYLVAPTFEATLAVRLLNGVGFGLLSSALISGVMLTIPAARRAEGAGWFSVGLSVAIGLGPFLALTLAQTGGMRTVLLVATGCAAATVVLLVLVGRGLPGPVPPEVGSDGPARRSLLDRRAVGLGWVAFLGGFAYSAILAFLQPATQGTPLAPAASLFFLVYALVVLGARPAAGILQDRRGERSVLVPAGVLFTAGMLGVVAAVNGWGLLAGALLLGLGWGTMNSAGQAAVVSRVPRARTGAALATYFLMLDAGTGLGPIILGWLVEPAGYGGVFGTAVVAAALTIPAYLRDVTRSERARETA